MLCRLDSENESLHHQGKLGASVGVFQMVITGKANAEQFEDMINILNKLVKKLTFNLKDLKNIFKL